MIGIAGGFPVAPQLPVHGGEGSWLAGLIVMLVSIAVFVAYAWYLSVSLRHRREQNAADTTVAETLPHEERKAA